MFTDPFPLKLKHFTVLDLTEDYETDNVFDGTFSPGRDVNLTNIHLTVENDDEYHTIDIKPIPPGEYDSYDFRGNGVSTEILGYLIQQLTSEEGETLEDFMLDLCMEYSRNYNVFIDGDICNRVVLSTNQDAPKLSNFWTFDTDQNGYVNPLFGKSVSEEEQELLNEKLGRFSNSTSAFLEYKFSKMLHTKNVELCLDDKNALNKFRRTFAGSDIIYVKK